MKRKGFTLIELLAVIIILGILLLIAIPGVTGYINNSRKNIYVDTAKELVKGTSKLLNSGDFDTLDEDVTYYMDSRCIANESGKEAQSPFGKFNPAYVLVVNEEDEYNYYFQSRDETEVGVKDITKMDNLQISKIVSGVKEEDIDTSVGIGKTTKTAIIDEDCKIGEARVASRRVSKDGESMITLTFDNQGGTGCDMQSQYYGEEWGKLCKPKKEGWQFIGWYTKTDKLGDKITATTKAEKSMTVYAAWTDQYATFDTGPAVNAKMKSLSNERTVDLYSEDYKIINIRRSEDEPQDNNKIIVSSPSSVIPIYMWFDKESGIMYWWSESEQPRLNADSSHMFSKLKILQTIDELDLFDTSDVVNMNDLFAYSSMTSLDLSNFDTSKVTNMDGLFNTCKNLTYLDLSSFETNNVVDMGGMFAYSENINTIIFDNFNTSKVTDMEYLFVRNKKLDDLDLSSFDTSNVTSFRYLFSECSNLSSLDLSSFNTQNVKNMEYMFYRCGNLENIVISSFDTSKVTNMNHMFSECENLLGLDLSNFDTSNVTTMGYMLCYCRNLEFLNVSSFDTSNVTHMEYMFSSVGYSKNLELLDVSNFNTSKVTDMSSMFSNCSALKSLELSNFDTSKVTNMYNMFYDCSSATVIDVSSFNTSNVTCMWNMFAWCRKITNFNLYNFNTSNVTDMKCMFYYCDLLQNINLLSFDTSKVTDMSCMFERCKSFTTLDLSNFDTSSLKYIGSYCNGSLYSSMYGGMFAYCTNLRSINLSSFDTSNVIAMGKLFEHCESLVSIDLSNFDTSNVIDIYGMFEGCFSVETINISSFNTINAKYYHEMFWNCKKLKTIYVGDYFDVSSAVLTDSIFVNCYELVGGNGTTWSKSIENNITYARVDGKDGLPGLFTHI